MNVGVSKWISKAGFFVVIYILLSVLVPFFALFGFLVLFLLSEFCLNKIGMTLFWSDMSVYDFTSQFHNTGATKFSNNKQQNISIVLWSNN